MFTYLSASRMIAPISMNTAFITKGIRYGASGTSFAARPAKGGNIASPRVPKANCLPTSPRPSDVSRVAITQAAPRSASAAVGQMSANNLEKVQVVKNVHGIRISNLI